MKIHQNSIVSLAALLLGVALATAPAFAQSTSGRPGAHRNAPRTGSAASAQKILKRRHAHGPTYNYVPRSVPPAPGVPPGCAPSATGGGSAGWNRAENYCGY